MGRMERNPWWVVLGAFCGLFVGNGPIMQFTIGVLIKPIGNDMGWDRATISFAMVAGLVMTGLMTPLAGRLVDRFGVRAVTLPAIMVFSVLIASVAFVPASSSAFIAIYALMGVAAAGQTPLPYARAIAVTFDRKRGLALGIAMAGVGLGVAVVPQIVRLLIEHAGWRMAYLGLGALTCAVGLPAVALLIREPVKKTGSPNLSAPLPGHDALSSLGIPVTWQLAVTFFLVALATNGTIAHIVPLMTDRGISAGTATTALSGTGLALIAGRLVAGYLLDRVWGPYVAVFFFAAPLAGIVAVATSSTPGVAIAATMLIGLGLGAEVDLIAFFISRYLGLRAFGEIYGYMFAIFMFGSALGPFAMGLCFEHAASYLPALTVFAGLLGVAILLMLRLGAYPYPASGRD